MLEAALKMYRMDMGSYPTTEQGLQALVEMHQDGQSSGKWQDGGYLEKGVVPGEPWGHEYIHMLDSSHGRKTFDIISYGADGQPGEEGYDGDIDNWGVG